MGFTDVIPDVVLDRVRSYYPGQDPVQILNSPAPQFGGESPAEAVQDGTTTWEQVLATYSAMFPPSS